VVSHFRQQGKQIERFRVNCKSNVIQVQPGCQLVHLIVCQGRKVAESLHVHHTQWLPSIISRPTSEYISCRRLTMASCALQVQGGPGSAGKDDGHRRHHYSGRPSHLHLLAGKFCTTCSVPALSSMAEHDMGCSDMVCQALPVSVATHRPAVGLSVSKEHFCRQIPQCARVRLQLHLQQGAAKLVLFQAVLSWQLLQQTPATITRRQSQPLLLV
jgi:hypothetical protein